MTYSFKDVTSELFNQYKIMNEDYFNSLEEYKGSYDRNKLTTAFFNGEGKKVTKIKPYIDVMGYTTNDKVLVTLCNYCIFRIISNINDLKIHIDSDISMEFDKYFNFDIDGNILCTHLDNFPKININEIDEEMDFYLTLKYGYIL